MTAYSRLRRILKQRQISIPELYRRIHGNGLRVNLKSLYRLSDEDHPVERLDMRVAGAICEVCSIPLSDWIVFESDDSRLRTLTAGKQRRLDQLMAQNNIGPLAAPELTELRELVREAEEITLS